LGTLLFYLTKDVNKKNTNRINILFNKLASKAIYTSDGVRFVNLGLKRFTNMDIDLSLAHGLSGFLLLVLKAWPVLENKEEAKKIVREGIRFISARKLPIRFPEDDFSLYATAFKEGDKEMKRFNRLAWCYGDLNFVLLLHRAANVLNCYEYSELAMQIGANTVLRKDEKSTMVNDSHFCHGSSGLFVMYQTLFRETGLSMYEDAMNYWYDQTVMFTALDLEKNKYTNGSISLLEGWTGVALSLISKFDTERSCWQEIFLL
jgi:hypothetical protein